MTPNTDTLRARAFDGTLLFYYRTIATNGIRAAISRDPMGFWVVFFFCVWMAGAVVAFSYTFLFDHRRDIEVHPETFTVIVAALSAAAACRLALRISRVLLDTAYSAWLLVLPISIAGRVRMAATAGLWALLAITLLFGCWAAGAQLRLRLSHPLLRGVALSSIFFCAGALTLCWKLWPQHGRAERARSASEALSAASAPVFRESRREIPRYLVWLDNHRPAWTGIWTFDANPLRKFPLETASLVLVAVFAIIASLVQHRGLIALIAGAAGAHALFVIALRAHPLSSAVFRSTQLGFFAAWAGVTRLPLVLSLAVFAVMACIGMIASPDSAKAAGMLAVALMLANGLYATILANMPTMPVAARAAHVAAMSLLVYFTTAWAYTGPVAISAFLARTLYVARRTYRGQAAKAMRR